MKQFFIRLFFPLIRDDLFLRVTCALGGLFSWTIASLLATVPLESTRLRDQILSSVFVIVFGAIGAPLILRSVTSVRSRLGEIFDRYMTPTNLRGSLTGDAMGVALLFLLPAILLTLLLRGLGIRGQIADWCRSADQ